jgi:hypothetical protein
MRDVDRGGTAHFVQDLKFEEWSQVERLELTKDDPPPPPMKPLSVRSGSVGSLTELNEHGALTALAAAMGSLAPPPLRRKESVSRILDAQKAAPLREVRLFPKAPCQPRTFCQPRSFAR